MSDRGSAWFGGAALLSAAGLCAPAWGAPPQGVQLRDASIAIGYDPKGRCPELLQADPQDGSAALVVLVVGPSGVPSQPSIKSSSGSDSLDAAAISCVMKLRFLPAVRAGEGLAAASWQEIAWKWGRGHAAASAPTAAASAGPSVTATTSAPAVAAATLTAGSTVAAATPAAVPAAAPAPSPAAAGSAEVRVCADETGRLTQAPVITRSSGDPALDEAAVRVAGSGAPYYQPAAAAAVSGCARLAIKFETK